MGRVVTFVETYLVALVVAMTLGLAAYLALRGSHADGPPGFDVPAPTPLTVHAYVLEYGPTGGSTKALSVDGVGAACRTLAASPVFAEACVLALSDDPTFIASQAYGRLNTEDTPSFQALSWRATLDADPDLCNRAGLLGDRLVACRLAASSGLALSSQDGLTIVVKPVRAE